MDGLKYTLAYLAETHNPWGNDSHTLSQYFVGPDPQNVSSKVNYSVSVSSNRTTVLQGHLLTCKYRDKKKKKNLSF